MGESEWERVSGGERVRVGRVSGGRVRGRVSESEGESEREWGE